MKEFFLKIYDLLSKRIGVTSMVLALLLGISAVLISRMHYEEDISAFLPSDEVSQRYSSVYGKLGGDDKIAIFFHMDEPDQDRIMDAMDRFEQVWRQTDTLGMVPDFQVTVDESSVYDVFDFIGSNYVRFLSDKDLERIDSLLSEPGYIEQKMQENRRTLLLPSAGMMGDNIAYDPLGLFTPVLLRLQELDPTGGSNLIDGYLFSEDETRGIAFFTSPFGDSESGRNSDLTELLDTVAELTMQEFSDVEVSSIGGPVIAVANSSRIKKDSIISVAVAAILILLVLYFSFRRFRDIFWIAFSIFCGFALALAMVSLFKDSISIIVLGIGSIIIGIAVNYPLHYIDHLKHEPDRRAALSEMVEPLLVGNVTTVSAFLALLLLKAKALHDFGLVGAMVLIGTIVFSLIFLPVLCGDRKPVQGTWRLDFDRHVTLSHSQRKVMFVLFVLVSLVLSVFAGRTSFDSDMHHINYMSESQQRDLDILSTLQGEEAGVTSVYAVTEGVDMESVLKANEKMLSLSRDNGAGTVSSLAQFIPSMQRQDDVIKKWSEICSRYPELIPELRAAASRNGFREGAFSGFEEVVSGENLRAEGYEYFEPIVDALGSTFILSDESGISQVVNYIKVEDSAAEAFKTSLRQSTDSRENFFFDSTDVSGQLVSLLSADFNNVGFLCGFIVFFFLWVSFGSLELSLLSFLPLAVSWIWILGMMNLTGIQFNIVNIILATFIFGQGDDYTIFITEGLMYEYAYGKKILASYKNSVALSAIIMFIGIGTLVLAKHPAMKSLAYVTIIGMFTVVLMAYYLPPLVFRWITTSGGKTRPMPLTIGRILGSLRAILFFLFAALTLTVEIPIWFISGKSEKKRLAYHRLLQIISSYAIKHVPGTLYSMSNPHGETFRKPAVYICNHQSHLDIMAIMALTPKVVVLTKDWVWKNPLYGVLIRYAEFYPMSDGVDANIERLRDLVGRGYSIVIFPEGTRTENGRIGRFHRGAFLIAEQLGLDILPLYIHGFYDVLPKNDFMLRRGRMYLEVGKRISADDPSMGEDFKARTKAFHRMYLEEYRRICLERQNAGYFLPFVRGQYLYKGSDVMAAFKRQTTPEKLAEIDNYKTGEPSVEIRDCGCGAYALLLALTHPDLEVKVSDSNPDNLLLIERIPLLPSNLSVVRN